MSSGVPGRQPPRSGPSLAGSAATGTAGPALSARGTSPDAAGRSGGTGGGTGPPRRPELAVVVAGANRPAVRTLVEALVGGVPHLGTAPDGCYLTIRAGARRAPRAFVPGYRQPRPYPVPDGPGAAGLAGVAGHTDPAAVRDAGKPGTLIPPAALSGACDADVPAVSVTPGALVAPAASVASGALVAPAVSGAVPAARWPARPPRGIEVTHPAPLLERLALVVAPTLAASDQAAVRVILDLVERGAALIFVTDTTAPIGGEHAALLAAAVRRTRGVFLAVADDHESDQWPDVVGANQSSLARQVPELTLARWFVVVPRRVPGGDDRAAQLREALAAWADGERIRRRATARGRSSRTVRVGAHSVDCGWERVLDRSIRIHRQASGQEISIELSRIHLRCVQRITDHGCASLPAALDRELHGLSLLATRATRNRAQDTLGAVLGQVLERAPDHDLVRRVIPAVRARLAGSDQARWDRALLVITAGGVAEVVGVGALAGLSAYRPAGSGTPVDPALLPPLLAPFGLAVAASCYAMWPRSGAADRKRCRQWLQVTIRALETTLHRELAERFGDLHQGIHALIRESVDRGLLQI